MNIQAILLKFICVSLTSVVYADNRDSLFTIGDKVKRKRSLFGLRKILSVGIGGIQSAGLNTDTSIRLRRDLAVQSANNEGGGGSPERFDGAHHIIEHKTITKSNSDKIAGSTSSSKVDPTGGDFEKSAASETGGGGVTQNHGGLGTGIGDVASKVVKTVGNTAVGIGKTALNIGEQAMDVGGKIVQGVGNVALGIAKHAVNIAKGLLDTGGEIFNKAGQTAIKFGKTAISVSQDLFTQTANTVMGAANTIIGVGKSALDLGGNMVGSVGKGILNTGSDVGQNVVRQAGVMIETGANLIGSTAAGLVGQRGKGGDLGGNSSIQLERA